MKKFKIEFNNIIKIQNANLPAYRQAGLPVVGRQACLPPAYRLPVACLSADRVGKPK